MRCLKHVNTCKRTANTCKRTALHLAKNLYDATPKITLYIICIKQLALGHRPGLPHVNLGNTVCSFLFHLKIQLFSLFHLSVQMVFFWLEVPLSLGWNRLRNHWEKWQWKRKGLQLKQTTLPLVPLASVRFY